MSLLKAEKGSNAAQPTSDDGPTAGALGMIGFTPVGYQSQKPAKSNADISTTDTAPGLGNDGTNLSAYQATDQPEDISGKTGK